MTPTLRKLWPVVLTAVSVMLLAGCNDTLRQFIIPVPKPTGDTAGTAHAVVLSTNPSGRNGSTVHIDVSGDTLAGIVDTGMDPVFLGKGPGRVYVINRNAAANDASTGSDTLTSYGSTSPLATTPNTITMPSQPVNSMPSQALNPIAGGVGSSGDFFVANPTSTTLSQVAQFAQAVTNTISIPLGSAQGVPVAIAGNAAQAKIYVVNHVSGGPGYVTVISTTDNTVVKPSIAVGLNPIWAVMSNDGVFVFVVNQGDGTVMVIDTTLDIVLPCNGVAPRCQNGAINVGKDPTISTSSPNFAFYDSKLQRLYVTNTGDQSVGVIKADGINAGTGVFPSFLASVQVSGTPVSVTALSDGSKAYAALGNCPAGTNHTNLVTPDLFTGSPTPPALPGCNGATVSVISASSLAETSTITVGSGVVSVDSASDASRVYAVSAHTGNVSIIKPSNDSVLATFPVPQQNPACTSSCALQIPFSVRVFP
jgi:DNA-binding beta-propeller fold protein YncE